VNEPIDLDANATTPLLPAARDAMFELADLGNPASSHSLGRKARKHLEDARERIGSLLGAHPDEVIFTSGATEANNLAISSLAGRHVLASPMEHPCVIEPLKKSGAKLTWMPVSHDGIAAFDVSQLTMDVTFITLQMVNHETGAIQHVRPIASRIPSSILFHVDAAQAAGKLPVDFHDLALASLSISGHKFRGPTGIGALLIRRGVQLRPQLFGGHQQGGRRPGTESAMLAVGMAVALEQAVHHMREHKAKLETLRGQLWEQLQSHASPLVLNGPANAFPGTLNVSFPGCRGDLLMMALDLSGVACSTGSACSSGSLLPSPVLTAMGVPDDVLRSAIRLSFGSDLSVDTMDEAARRIGIAVRKQREL
jgi:cysteine desulfurase